MTTLAAKARELDVYQRLARTVFNSPELEGTLQNLQQATAKMEECSLDFTYKLQTRGRNPNWEKRLASDLQIVKFYGIDYEPSGKEYKEHLESPFCGVTSKQFRAWGLSVHTILQPYLLFEGND